MSPKPTKSSVAPLWQPSGRVYRSQIPGRFRGWLLDPGSLTHRLKQVCGATFQVWVLRQSRCRPRIDEARALKLAPSQRGLIREVKLMCHGKPCVFARTVIPFSTLTGKRRRLGRLGNRPLGAFLFAAPNMRRGPVEISRMDQNHDLYTLALTGLKQRPSEIWGRRTVYYLGKKPLLVSEIFLSPPSPCPKRRPYTPG